MASGLGRAVIERLVWVVVLMKSEEIGEVIVRRVVRVGKRVRVDTIVVELEGFA